MYEFDDSRRPLVVLRMRERAPHEATEQMRRDLFGLMDHHEPFAIVIDIVDVEIPPRKNVMEVLRWSREMRGRFSREFDDVTPRIVCFSAFHMPSMLGNLLRFSLQMLPSIRSQHVVCASFEQALAACEQAVVQLEMVATSSRHLG